MNCYKIIVLEVICVNYSITNKNDEMVMALVHYFITEENYTPIMVKGVKDEIWLENIDGPYRIIRINSNHIHNAEQYDFDIFKTGRVIDQIRKKTLSLKMNALNILVDVGYNLDLKQENKNILSIVLDDVSKFIDNKNIKDLFPNIQNKLIKDKEGIELIINVTNDINAKTIEHNEEYTKIFSPKKIVITPILILICFIMFFLMYILGNGSEDVDTLKFFGANSQVLVKAGQVWRLLTSVFLHIGIIHLLVNMYSLFIIGGQLETFLGKAKYLIVFLVSGLIGSLFSCIMHNTVSAGASGAIFGLLGSLLYFGYHYRLYLGSVLKSQIIPIIVLNLIIGFMSNNIDNFAHIGGLIGGYLATMAVGIPGKKRLSDQINGTIVLGILILFLGFMLYR